MQVSGKVQEAMGEDKLDALVCVAGGWAGGNAASPGVCVCQCSYLQILAVVNLQCSEHHSLVSQMYFPANKHTHM